MPNKQSFTPETLKGYRILIIANALGHQRMSAPEASNPAFTQQESDAVRDWVRAGGALLLIADHSPMGAANQILAQRFDIDMSKGYTSDPDNYDKDSNNQGFIVYTRESGRLADHPMTRGRNADEKLNTCGHGTGPDTRFEQPTNFSRRACARDSFRVWQGSRNHYGRGCYALGASHYRDPVS
jgi:hypothetical protein